MIIGFFEMGGYASFIWPSYGITFIALIWLFLASWQRAKNATTHLHNAKTPEHD